jgi:hypothetical protein
LASGAFLAGFFFLPPLVEGRACRAGIIPTLSLTSARACRGDGAETMFVCHTSEG